MQFHNHASISNAHPAILLTCNFSGLDLVSINNTSSLWREFNQIARQAIPGTTATSNLWRVIRLSQQSSPFGLVSLMGYCINYYLCYSELRKQRGTLRGVEAVRFKTIRPFFSADWCSKLLSWWHKEFIMALMSLGRQSYRHEEYHRHVITSLELYQRQSTAQNGE